MDAAPENPKTAYVAWSLQIIAALIFIWAGVPKLFGALDAKELFTALGVEPAGRIFTGLAELLAALLILLPRTARLGGGFGMLLMVGALFGHVFRLGFDGPYGMMAALAFIVFLLCGSVFFLHRR